MSSFSQVLEQARESIGVKRVFGEPYEKNGVTVIPAARIMGGVGGGEGDAPKAAGEEGEEASGQRASGAGGGYGLTGGPAGVYVIKGDDVKWIPAVDVNRLMLGFQIVMVVFFLAMRSISRARANPAKTTG
jgi:uncharacterized spore protein YtfJ